MRGRYHVISVCMLMGLSACGQAGVDFYRPPAAAPAGLTMQVAASRAKIMTAAATVLQNNLYPLMSRDPATGEMVTAQRTLSITPREADCGTRFGIDYLPDLHTTARLGFSVSAQDGFFVIHALISAVYTPENGTSPQVLPCHSRGVYEDEMANAIVAALEP
jgi:hypothetical protein